MSGFTLSPPPFSQGIPGLVPAPTGADVAASKVLRADGAWAAVSASGTAATAAEITAGTNTDHFIAPDQLKLSSPTFVAATLSSGPLVLTPETAQLTLGTTANATATNRKTLNFVAGGFAEPGGYLTSSNGDKIVLWRSTAGTYDAAMGVGTAADFWFKSTSAGATGGIYRWFNGSTPTKTMELDTTSLTLTQATASISTSTGALVLSGSNAGLGMAGAANIGGNVTVGLGSGSPTVTVTGGSGANTGASVGFKTDGSYIGSIGRAAVTDGGSGADFQIQSQGGVHMRVGANGAQNLYLQTDNTIRVTVAPTTGNVSLASTTEATTGGAGSLTTAGGIYAAKAIVGAGARLVKVSSKTASYTITTSDHVIVFSGSTGSQTLTLPAVSGTTGQILRVKNRASVAVTVASNSGSEIFSSAAVASVSLNTGDSVKLVSDGTYWNVV